jgi:8-oxo-dGTP pyrophosphatase MutT (NUDIX family)
MQQIPNLLASTEPQSFGVPHENEISRKTIVAVIYDPRSRTFLCQFWPDYHKLTCLLSGGVESLESTDDALRREIKEETGYIDYEILGKLGGTIYSHYFKAKSSEYFVKEITPYLVILRSRTQQGLQKEADEVFENLLRGDGEIFEMMGTYERTTGTTLADHKDILQRGVDYINRIKL